MKKVIIVLFLASLFIGYIPVAKAESVQSQQEITDQLISLLQQVIQQLQQQIADILAQQATENTVQQNQPPEIPSNEINQPQSSIIITSPTNSPQWERTKTYTITWSSSGVALVNIELLKGATGVPIATDVPSSNGGSYQWTVPSDFSLGYYRIHIWSSFPDTQAYGSGTITITTTSTGTNTTPITTNPPPPPPPLIFQNTLRIVYAPGFPDNSQVLIDKVPNSTCGSNCFIFLQNTSIKIRPQNGSKRSSFTGCDVIVPDGSSFYCSVTLNKSHQITVGLPIQTISAVELSDSNISEQTGGSTTISWYSGTTRVNVELIDSYLGGPWNAIPLATGLVAANGVNSSYQWFIPLTFLDDKEIFDYKNFSFKIRIVNSSDSTDYSDSRTFFMVSKATPSISIVNPHTNIVCIIGTDCVIQWETKGPAFYDNVNISYENTLYPDSLTQIASNVPASKFFYTSYRFYTEGLYKIHLSDPISGISATSVSFAVIKQ